MRNKIKNVLPTVFKAAVIGAIYAIFSWIYFELAIRCDFYSCFAGIYDYSNADYVASNACYEKIGYVQRGKLCIIG